MRNVLFVKYNGLRRPEFRITTTIYEADGERFVEKAPNSSASWNHVDDFQKNCQLLRKAHRNVEAAEPTIANHIATYEYIPGKTLEEELQEAFEDVENLIDKIQENLSRIYEYDENYMIDFRYTQDFGEIFCSGFSEEERTKVKGLLENRPSTIAANIDLVFDNIIRKNDKWVLLDYEWVFEFPVPIDFLRFRTAAYFYDRHNLYFSGKYNRQEFFLGLGFGDEEVEVLDKMEASFQRFVRGDHQYMKAYEKEIIPFRAYETYAQELSQRDASIQFLNEVISSQNEYITSMEQLIQKYHSNPAYKLMNGVRKVFRKIHK